MLPRSSATLTSSSTSILSSTLWALASILIGATPLDSGGELRIGLVPVHHPLDVGAHAPHLVRGPGPEVDVGEEPARAPEDEDPAAHVDRFLELVRHEDRGVALHPREVDEGPPERGRRHLVQVAEGLVGEQERRLDGEGPGERHALPHAAGQLVRIRALEARQVEPLEPRPRALDLLAGIAAEQLQRETDVVDGRPPRQQAVLLEDRGEHAAEMVEVVVGRPAPDGDAAAGGPVEPDEEIQEGRLAASGLAHDGHHVALPDHEVEALDGHHRLPGARLVEDLAEPLDLDRARALHARQRSTRSSTRASRASARKRITTRMRVHAKTSATEKSSWATTRP